MFSDFGQLFAVESGEVGNEDFGGLEVKMLSVRIERVFAKFGWVNVFFQSRPILVSGEEGLGSNFGFGTTAFAPIVKSVFEKSVVLSFKVFGISDWRFTEFGQFFSR